MKQFRLVLFGRVQGVGFRFFSLLTAKRLGVTGFCQNKANGTIELVIQASNSACQEFIQRVQKEPPWAHVQNSQITEEKPSQKMNRFEIRF